LEYSHSFTASHGACVIGGYVYRGPSSVCHYGRYIFADQTNGLLLGTKDNGVWSMKRIKGACATNSPFTCDNLNSITSFTEDTQGNVYVLGSTSLSRVVDMSRCASSAGLYCSQHYTTTGIVSTTSQQSTSQQTTESTTAAVVTTDTLQTTAQQTTNQMTTAIIPQTTSNLATTSSCSAQNTITFSNSGTQFLVTNNISPKRAEVRTTLFSADFFEVYKQIRENSNTYNSYKSRLLSIVEFVDTGAAGYLPSEDTNSVVHRFNTPNAETWSNIAQVGDTFNTNLNSLLLSIRGYVSRDIDPCSTLPPSPVDVFVDLDFTSRMTLTNSKLALSVRYNLDRFIGGVNQGPLDYDTVRSLFNFPTYVNSNGQTIPLILRYVDVIIIIFFFLIIFFELIFFFRTNIFFSN